MHTILKRDVINIFLKEGLFVGSKIYSTGVKNKKNKVQFISFPFCINKGCTQADPQFRGPIKEQD